MWYRGGDIRSSDETAVMVVERRGVVIQLETENNWKQEDWMNNSKPYNISKKIVLEAYKLVKRNKGSAGIDGVVLINFRKI